MWRGTFAPAFCNLWVTTSRGALYSSGCRPSGLRPTHRYRFTEPSKKPNFSSRCSRANVDRICETRLVGSGFSAVFVAACYKVDELDAALNLLQVL
ncbi:hypothetical protein K491DRAFT_428580 [Lophiostoma macrostomum CBS 122681]|uniref:Uncharacterized protein n=1 Tax=Lophiostoma macrostomum CBS 122681 TaxID=1314788 RepID=A0A6A6T9A8_9PLEO|nr:hypothetical protein K491DRAFT_428580 [Lophiostoma macrostomum CBS 122681]